MDERTAELVEPQAADKPQRPDNKIPKLIDMKDVLKIVPLSRASISRLIKRNEFVEAVWLGSQPRFVEDEVRAWLQDRLNNRGRRTAEGGGEGA